VYVVFLSSSVKLISPGPERAGCAGRLPFLSVLSQNMIWSMAVELRMSFVTELSKKMKKKEKDFNAN
jgi:hypothetical protein